MKGHVEKIAVVCEGTSDIAFLRALFHQRKIDATEINVLEIPKNMAGLGGFADRLLALVPKSGGECHKLIVVVADNDDDPAGRFSIVQESIRSTEVLGVPNAPQTVAESPKSSVSQPIPSIVVLMLPTVDEIGNLETILFRSGKDKAPALADCTEGFSVCAGVDKWSVAMRDKLKTRIMLSATAKTNPNVSFLGAWQSSSGNPFPIESQHFDRIVDFFRDLLAHF